VTDADELLRLPILGETDVFLVRQRGREVAAAVGLEDQDRIRVATVLSDLGRELVRQATLATVLFRLRPFALVIELAWRGGPLGPGGDVAARLVDDVSTTHTGDRWMVTLVKNLPPTAPDVTPGRLDRLRAELDRLGGGSPLDELRAQNQQLLETLDSLARANDELAETNRGVVALYKELSDELEHTNRGVVALYAELDEKSTQIKEAGEARTRFWSSISHELRTPINSVIGLARLLSADGGDPLTEDQRRQVELINDSGVTLLALVNELLDTAKADSGQLRPQLAVIDLVVLFRQLRGTLRPMAPAVQVELVIEDPPPGLPVVTDETMLTRILRNLLSNALKFTEQGEVRLTVRAEPAVIVFEVADTGIGIPDDQLERVFEEFHQVPGALQVRAGGTGLGLPYARRLAGILSGELTLCSELGTGTTVSLRIPLRRLDAPPPEVDSVLVVDDDPEFRGLLRAIVTDFAHTVTEAADGRAALNSVAARRPDLVFLDLSMPTMGGGEVLSVLRQNPDLRQVPVVLVTSGDPVGIDLTVSGLGAALLPKAQVSAESVRLAMREAMVVVPR
jgi:signal transduction histidine kinase/CheY-like chemotaxis protein